MVDINMYQDETTDASKSALLEALQILGSYRDDMVLVGGWAPYFILDEFGDNTKHCGSKDIDFALSPGLMNKSVYKTIAKSLEEHGYSEAVDDNGKPLRFKFVRDDIEIDFLIEPETMENIEGKLAPVQADLSAIVVPGISSVFRHNFTHTIKGVLPTGAETKAEVKIADTTGCLLTKGRATSNRVKEKDWYDIYMVIKHYKDGPKAAASAVKPYKDEEFISNSLDNIRNDFANEFSRGSDYVGRFISPLNPEAKKRAQADAYITLKKFFEELDRGE